MERLPSLEELGVPDERHLSFSVIDPTADGGFRPFKFEDNHLEMAALELSASVPEPITSSFAIARTVWLYGWYYWPFYTVANHLGHICVEMALRDRAQREVPDRYGAGKSPPRLKELFDIAIARNWLRDSEYEHIARADQYARELETDLVELGWHQPSEALPPDKYVRVLARVMPRLRNYMAHGESSFVDLRGNGRMGLQIARDTIAQLFRPM